MDRSRPEEHLVGPVALVRAHARMGAGRAWWAERLRTLDLPLLLGAIVVAATILWAVLPPARAVTASDKTTVMVGSDSGIAVVPGFTHPNSATSLTLADLTVPGQQRDGASDGWTMTTNWVNGYTVTIRSLTDPAMRGRNATDGQGAADSFADFTVSGCPCPWKTTGFKKAVFGYSASVSGGESTDASKWGTAGNRKWRGFDDTEFTVFTTSGGGGMYEASILFRTALPEDAVQLIGSYRANVVLSVHANL